MKGKMMEDKEKMTTKDEMGAKLTIDTTNVQMVALTIGGSDARIAVQLPKTSMTQTEALVHAAWIVSLVGDDDLWKEALEAVQNT